MDPVARRSAHHVHLRRRPDGFVQDTDGSVIGVASFGANGLLSSRNLSNGVSSFYTFDLSGNTCQSLTSADTPNYTNLVSAFGLSRSRIAVGVPGREHGLYLPAGAPVLRRAVRPVHDARSDGVQGRGEPVRVYGQ